MGVEHDSHTLLVHISDEDGRGWTTVALDRRSRACRSPNETISLMLGPPPTRLSTADEISALCSAALAAASLVVEVEVGAYGGGDAGEFGGGESPAASAEFALGHGV